MATSRRKTSQLRLRIFAGPNGSGKSTIIHSVRNLRQNNRPIDFGYYINADDIATDLKNGRFSFARFKLKLFRETLLDFAIGSGLLNKQFSVDLFGSVFSINKSTILMKDPSKAEQVAQIIARFLREELLRLERRFSFETVFSHPSTLEIMQQAVASGYKVYLYFVSTESPEINKYRVAYRVTQDGHDVDPGKIESRYYRSLDLMKAAAQFAYQAFFFDNSYDDVPFTLSAHFKITGGKKKWDKIPKRNVAGWFSKYYGAKISMPVYS